MNNWNETLLDAPVKKKDGATSLFYVTVETKTKN